MADCTAPRHGDQPQPAAPHARLCHGCRSRLRSDLRRLPQLHHDLGELLDPIRGLGNGGGDGGGLPWHEPAAEAMSQIAHDTEAWVAIIAADRETATLPGRTIPAMCGWLLGWSQWASYQPWAGDIATVFAEVRGRAWAILNPMPRAEIPLPHGARCPQCGNPGLTAVIWQAPGDQRPSMVSCACGAQWDTTP